jgi:hypothetical protein
MLIFNSIYSFIARVLSKELLIKLIDYELTLNKKSEYLGGVEKERQENVSFVATKIASS